MKKFAWLLSVGASRRRRTHVRSRWSIRNCQPARQVGDCGADPSRRPEASPPRNGVSTRSESGARVTTSSRTSYIHTCMHAKAQRLKDKSSVHLKLFSLIDALTNCCRQEAPTDLDIHPDLGPSHETQRAKHSEAPRWACGRRGISTP
jgi:hypothetical protein